MRSENSRVAIWNCYLECWGSRILGFRLHAMTLYPKVRFQHNRQHLSSAFRQIGQSDEMANLTLQLTKYLARLFALAQSDVPQPLHPANTSFLRNQSSGSQLLNQS